MKKQVSPVVAIVAIVLVLAVAALWIFRNSGMEQKYGAEMPEVVKKEFQEKGPRPMPPPPMPAGGTFDVPGATRAGQPGPPAGGR